ncbi:hypothetical protein CBS101457_003339 [Exobasidium rhododendri]|nr:hypothetical protein CBS101457_003339 [Exobasidium rhododendri]
MASSLASSSVLSAEVGQAITAFLAGAYEDEKVSLVEVTLPPAILSPFIANPPSLRLVDLIKNLGSSFTAEDEMERSRAVVLLSLLVTTLVSEHSSSSSVLFDKQATTTLAKFFASKLEDGNVVADSIAKTTNAITEIVPGSAPEARRKKYPPGTEMLVTSIRALTALAKLEKFASEAAKVTTESLLAHSNPRLHPQAVRFLIYLLMDTLLSRHRQALKSMGSPFLTGYIELVEGEKDPRNLVYIFAMDRVLLVEWEMDKEMIEAFFDVTYCYFPITFRPPPDDPYGISTNTLRLALRKALTSSPLLAPHALPLLIEKMQASGGNAKRDTLETLEEVLPIFGRSAALAHIKDLWEGFKIEIMHATDDATAICSTKALESLLFVLYVGEEEAQGVATEMVADMLDELEEPSKQQAKPAAAILATMIRATSATSKLAIFATLDQLFTMYKDPEEPSVRGPILDHITTIIKAIQETYQGPSDMEEGERREEAEVKDEGRFTFDKPSSATVVSKKKVEGSGKRTYEGDHRPLDTFRDVLLSTLAHGLKTSSTRVASIGLFVTLSHIDFLDPSELRHLCDSVNELLIDPDAEQVRVQTLEGLRELGNKKVIEESTLPLLFGLLPDRIAGQGNDKVKGDIRRSLGGLARLCDSTELFDMMIVRLSTKLDLVCASAEERESNIGYARGIVNTIRIVLEEKMKRKDRDTARYGSLIPRLIGNVVEASLRSTKDRLAVAVDRFVIQDIGSLVTLLTRCLDVTKQREMSLGLYSFLMNGDLSFLSQQSSILSRFLSSSSISHLDLFSADVTSAQRDTLHTLVSALVALKKEVPGPSEDMPGFISRVLQWTLASQTHLQERAGSALLANSINKYIAEPISSSFEAMLHSMWTDEIDRDEMQVDGVSGKVVHRQKRAVRLWLTMARGLLVRNSPTGLTMMDSILSLLRGATTLPNAVIKEAARGLGKVTAEDEVLCKENGSVIRLLYKQRFVTYVLPKLLEGFHHTRSSTSVTSPTSSASSSSSSSIHLIAICSLLPSLPKATLLEKLTEIFPLLILALDLQDDESVKSSAANVLTLATAVGKRERDETISTSNAQALHKGHYTSDETISIKEKRNSLDLVKDQVSAIIKRLLAILTSKSSSSLGEEKSAEGSKIAALRCLAMQAKSIDYPTLHPYKTVVLKVLGEKGTGVDDAKRSVRLEAVETRDAWFVLKGAGEDE